MSVGATPLAVRLLSAVTSGVSPPILVLPYVNLTIYVIGTGTIGAGTVIIEEATYEKNASPGAATWSAVTAGNPLDCTNVTGGAQQAYQLPIGVYHYIRARIGDTVTGGGSVSVVLCGN